MTPTPPPSAKERVLAFVRAANPQTMELKVGCKVDVYGYDPNGQITVLDFMNNGLVVGFTNFGVLVSSQEGYGSTDFPESRLRILGSDMGLQELLIAMQSFWSDSGGSFYLTRVIDALYFQDANGYHITSYDLTKNLHNQPEFFYESLLPLLP